MERGLEGNGVFRENHQVSELRSENMLMMKKELSTEKIKEGIRYWTFFLRQGERKCALNVIVEHQMQSF